MSSGVINGGMAAGDDTDVPKELENCQTLLNSEVYLLLEHRRLQSENPGANGNGNENGSENGAGGPAGGQEKQRGGGGGGSSGEDDPELSEVLLKTLAYTGRFSRFHSQQVIHGVRTMLQPYRLTKVEVATLANLCPESADEARALVPGLEGRFDDQELQHLLDQLQAARSYRYCSHQELHLPPT